MSDTGLRAARTAAGLELFEAPAQGGAAPPRSRELKRARAEDPASLVTGTGTRLLERPVFASPGPKSTSRRLLMGGSLKALPPLYTFGGRAANERAQWGCERACLSSLHA